MVVPKRAPLEIFKFSVYIILPIATIAYISEPKAMRDLIESRRYIIYPPEGDRPPQGSIKDIKAALNTMKNEKAAEDGVEISAAEAVPGVHDMVKPVVSEMPSPGEQPIVAAVPVGQTSSGWVGWVWGSK
mmetsp:Transcript_11686/g.18883  ORF Transcript_11686/g.18883 Transcript_11686/m.18883 type:complete len:130 (-) Transcript_11686:131-520(-)